MINTSDNNNDNSNNKSNNDDNENSNMIPHDSEISYITQIETALETTCSVSFISTTCYIYLIIEEKQINLTCVGTPCAKSQPMTRCYRGYSWAVTKKQSHSVLADCQRVSFNYLSAG